MTTYIEYHVNLSDGQKANLAKAIESSSEITLRLKNNQLRGNDELMLTKSQIKKIEKAARNNTGVDIKISKMQMRKSVKHGGSLFSSLLSLGTKLLPYATKFAAPLATGALSALGSLGMNKIFGKGQNGGLLRGGFLIPNDKIELLIKNKNLLTKKQKEHILNSLQSGGQVVVTPSAKQRGGALGTLLASIGIPLAVELGKNLFGQGGKCLHVPSKGKGLQVGPKPGMRSYQPPPFFGNWGNPTGSGTKKKFRKRIASRPRTSLWPKQPIRSHSNLGKHLLEPKFKDIHPSNFDLLNWIDYLRISNFKGIFSRDSKNHLHKTCSCKTGSCIINLDDGIGPGTHWVATFITDDSIYYFDSFSLPPPQEFVEYAEKLGKRYKFHYGYPIQDITSVRCGYYCLYFLDNIHKKSFYQCLKVFKYRIQ